MIIEIQEGECTERVLEIIAPRAVGILEGEDGVAQFSDTGFEAFYISFAICARESVREHQRGPVVNRAATKTIVLDLSNDVLANSVDIFVCQTEEKKRVNVHNRIDVAAVDVDPTRWRTNPGREQPVFVFARANSVERARRDRNFETLQGGPRH